MKRMKHLLKSTVTVARPTACQVCGAENTVLVRDHDHRTGYFRGWICRRCNLNLGWYEQMVAHVRGATYAPYFEEVRKRHRAEADAAWRVRIAALAKHLVEVEEHGAGPMDRPQPGDPADVAAARKLVPNMRAARWIPPRERVIDWAMRAFRAGQLTRQELADLRRRT